jgi:hypothetical protein
MHIEIFEIEKNGGIEPIKKGSADMITVVMPSIDIGKACLAACRLIKYSGISMRMIIIHDTIRQGYVKSLNLIASHINSEFVAYVAEDVLAGKDWLLIAHQKLIKEKKSVLAFNDGRYQGDLATFGLVRKSFCEQFYGAGHIFFEGYKTHRADDELTLLAKLHSQFAFSPLALMIENDYRTQRPLNTDDVALFNDRKMQIIDQYKIFNQSN